MVLLQVPLFLKSCHNSRANSFNCINPTSFLTVIVSYSYEMLQIIITGNVVAVKVYYMHAHMQCCNELSLSLQADEWESCSQHKNNTHLQLDWFSCVVHDVAVFMQLADTKDGFHTILPVPTWRWNQCALMFPIGHRNDRIHPAHDAEFNLLSSHTLWYAIPSLAILFEWKW
jgi:hypothetical protein